MTPPPKTKLILDATVFIRLDFPQLLEPDRQTATTFYTTTGVVSELKDFRSKSNLMLLRQASMAQLIITDPNPENITKISQAIQQFDPRSPLSPIDKQVLSLAYQLQGKLMSHDFTVQNAAKHLGIAIQTLPSGKKVRTQKRWVLKCQSCFKKVSYETEDCPFCGGKLKRRSVL